MSFVLKSKSRPSMRLFSQTFAPSLAYISIVGLRAIQSNRQVPLSGGSTIGINDLRRDSWPS